jgi:hypothetical protein
MLGVALNAEMLQNRATQCRHLAGGIRNQQIKDRLLRLAAEYEEMATRQVASQKHPVMPIDLASRMSPRSR